MKSVLITGGTGSLGQALVAQLNEMPQVERILVYSRDEWKQAEMSEKFPPFHKVRYMLGDVRDRSRLRQAMEGVDTVIHTAALKRVDLLAYNPSEVIKTNVTGTQNVIDAATGTASHVMVISSDKAVAPTNIYGASKMMAEHYAVYSNSFAYPRGTKVSVARYGNVLGSRGSMVHIFKKRVLEKKPIEITDERCTRFLITLPDAVRFVLICVNDMLGGEIFVPRLKSVRVLDFAMALSPEREFVGLRPGGEKLHEVMIGAHEVDRTIQLGETRYAVLPHPHPWRADDITGVGFSGRDFNSCDNSYYSVDEIREILRNEGYL